MSNYRLTVRRRLALAVPGIVLLLFVTFGVRAQSQASTCPAGQYCSVTFDGTRYTVLGPCDLSSLSAMANGCLIVGSNPLPGLGGGGPLLVTGFNPGASIVQDYPTAT